MKNFNPNNLEDVYAAMVLREVYLTEDPDPDGGAILVRAAMHQMGVPTARAGASTRNYDDLV